MGIRYSGGKAVSENGRSYSGGQTVKVVIMGKEHIVNISDASNLTGRGVTDALIGAAKEQKEAADKFQEQLIKEKQELEQSKQKIASLESPSAFPTSSSQIFPYGQQSRSFVNLQPSSLSPKKPSSVPKPVFNYGQFDKQSRGFATPVSPSLDAPTSAPGQVSTGFEPSSIAVKQMVGNVKKGRSQAQIRADVARIKQERLEGSYEEKGRSALSPKGRFGKFFQKTSERLLPGFEKSQTEFFKSQGKIISLAEEKEQDFAFRLARIEGRRQSNKLEPERIAAQQRLEGTAKMLGFGVSGGIVSLEKANKLLELEQERETVLLKEKVKPIQAEISSFVTGALEERRPFVESKLTKDLSAATFTGSPTFGIDEFAVGKIPVLQKGIRGLTSGMEWYKKAMVSTPEKDLGETLTKISKVSKLPTSGLTTKEKTEFKNINKMFKDVATIKFAVDKSVKEVAPFARVSAGITRGVLRRPATTAIIGAAGFGMGGVSRLVLPSINLGKTLTFAGKATKLGLGGLFVGGTALRVATATDFDEGLSRIGESIAFGTVAVVGAKLGSATVGKLQTSFGTSKITSNITEFQPKQVFKQRSRVVKATRTNLQRVGLSDLELKRRLIPTRQVYGQQVSIRNVKGKIAGLGKIRKGFLVSTGKTTVGSFKVPKDNLNIIVRATKSKTVLSIRDLSSGKLIRKVSSPTPKGLKISSLTIKDFNIERVLKDLPGTLKLQKVKGASIDVTKKGQTFLTRETQNIKVFRSANQVISAKLRTTKVQPGTKTVKVGSARLTSKGLRFESKFPKEVSKLELTKIKIGASERLPPQLQRTELLRSGELKVTSIKPRKLITRVDVFSKGMGVEEILVVGKGKEAVSMIGRSFVRGIKAPAFLSSGVISGSPSGSLVPSIPTTSVSTGVGVTRPGLEFPLPNVGVRTGVYDISSNFFSVPVKQSGVVFPVLVGEMPSVRIKPEFRIGLTTGFGSLKAPVLVGGVSTKPVSALVSKFVSGQASITQFSSLVSPVIDIQPVVTPVLDPQIELPGFVSPSFPSFGGFNFSPFAFTPIIPFASFDPPSGGGGGRTRLRRVLGRQVRYQRSLASSSRIFRKVFKKTAASKKSPFVTGLEIRL